MRRKKKDKILTFRYSIPVPKVRQVLFFRFFFFNSFYFFFSFNLKKKTKKILVGKGKYAAQKKRKNTYFRVHHFGSKGTFGSFFFIFFYSFVLTSLFLKAYKKNNRNISRKGEICGARKKTKYLRLGTAF